MILSLHMENVSHVRSVLADICFENQYCLDDPEALIIFNEFGDSSLEFFIGLWFEKSDYIKLKNSVMDQIKSRFDEENIEIAFPHISLYTGRRTEPYPVTIVPPGKQ